MKWATVRRHQIIAFVSIVCRPHSRAWKSVVLWSWGLRPRLYAPACFAG